MFKPQRLIYREATNGTTKYTFDSRFLRGTQDVVTEGVPAAFEAVAKHPGEVVRVAADAVDLTVDGVRRSFEGAMKGMWTGGVETPKKVTEDLIAGPAELGIRWAEAVKAATWDTGKNIVHGEGKKAFKSLFWLGLGGTIAAPFRAVWNGFKGLANLVPDVVVGGAKTVGHVAGLEMDDEGELAPAKHGLVPAVGSILKGASKLLPAPFGGRFKRWLMSKKDARFDTSVMKKGSSSPKSAKGDGKSESWWPEDKPKESAPNHGKETHAAAPAHKTSAFGNKGGGHSPAAKGVPADTHGGHASAENGHAKPAQATKAQGDDALAAAVATASATDGHGHAPKPAASTAAPTSPGPTATAAPAKPATPPVHH